MGSLRRASYVLPSSRYLRIDYIPEWPTMGLWNRIKRLWPYKWQSIPAVSWGAFFFIMEEDAGDCQDCGR